MASKPGKDKGKFGFDLNQDLGFSLSSSYVRYAKDNSGNSGGNSSSGGGGGGGCCCCCCCCCGGGAAQLKER